MSPFLTNIGQCVPRLEDYDIDPVNGFLSSPPLKRLPALFHPWEHIMDHLHQLMISSSLRSWVLRLPLLDVNQLETKREWQRAHLVLTFIAHSYIIGLPKIDKVESVLPESVAVPWITVSKKLLVKPVMSYYAVELSNWYKLDSDGPLDLSNIAISHTFTGTVDEAWFYLVPLAIEAAGAPAIKGLVDAQQAILDKDHTALVSALYTISNATEGLTALLKRMYEKCDADIFFNRFRHYSRGSKNSQDVPNGVFYQGVTEMDEFVNLETPNPKGLIGTWRKYAGASAGQSPLIHTLDVGLDIHHVPMHGTLNESNPSFSTDSKSSLPARFPSKPHYVNPMLEMRESLSQDHQNFLRALGNGPSIRAHIASLSGDDNTAVVQFNRAVDNIKQFRDAHISLTAMYIVLQAKKAAAAAGESSSRVCVGTGGTDLVPFLKQTRDETVNALILLP